MEYEQIPELIGKTMVKVYQEYGEYDELHFETSCGKHYKFYHERNCCECVGIEDICGELSDLIESPLIMAEEATSSIDTEDSDYCGESQLWTFYKFATLKGYVTVRWRGSSNGYYSMSVDFMEVK
jgi:hypothetical protein